MKKIKGMMILCVLFIYANVLEGQNNDSQLNAVLNEVYNEDQGIRDETSRIMSSKSDSLIRDYIKRQNTIDSKNKQIVSAILDSIGWSKACQKKRILEYF